MKEVYRSFDRKLDVDRQSGYTITDTGNFYEVVFISVWSSAPGRVRIRKDAITPDDFADGEKLARIQLDIESGASDAGLAYWNGKWYSQDTIRAIQAAHQDAQWKKYV